VANISSIKRKSAISPGGNLKEQKNANSGNNGEFNLFDGGESHLLKDEFNLSNFMIQKLKLNV
jgi:hypothetical protein